MVHVQVTQATAEAERLLRQVWGGPLCVSGAKHTQAELLEIQDQLTTLPGFLGSSAQQGRVLANVVVSSALRPYPR